MSTTSSVSRAIVLSSLTLLLLYCSTSLFGQQPVQTPQDGSNTSLESAQRRLSLRLIQSGAQEGKNFVCSPHDLYITLALLTIAAEGTSQQELLAALSAESVEDVRLALNYADQIGLPSRFALGALVKPHENTQGLTINSKPSPESALAKAGFQEGDVLSHANGVPLRSFQQLGQILSLTCGEVSLTGFKSQSEETISASVQLDIHRRLVPVVQKNFVSSRVLLTSPRITPTENYLKQVKQLVSIEWIHNAFAKEGRWREHVTNYVRTSSGGRIDPATILSTIPTAVEEDIDFVIANSSSYEEYWQRPFVKQNEKEPFHTKEGRKDVVMMTRIGQFKYAEQPDAQVIEIPLDSCLNRVRIWLPAEDCNVAEILTRLSTTKAADEVEAGLQRTPVHLTLPLFRLESEIDEENLRDSLNLNRLFSDQAELGGLSSDSMVGVIAQVATFDCREDGIRATSTTRIVGVPKGGVPQTREVTINRPFYFELIEASGAVLYAGVVNSPTHEPSEPKQSELPPGEENGEKDEEHAKPHDSALPTGSADV